MAEANISKAEKKITLLSEKVGATPDGQLWMKQALDPFCDEPRRSVGFPDMEIGASVVQTIKQTVSYTVGATAEDVHIFMDTIDCRVTMYSNTNYTNPGPPLYTVRDNFLADAVGGIASYARGGVVIRSGAVGTPLLTTTTSGTNGGLPDSYLSGGSARILSKAFEVHNVTPQLQVGGSVAVYRSPGDIPYNKPITSTLRNPVTPTTNFSSYQTYTLSKVPTTLAEVMLFANTQQWNAKDGCYVVAVAGAQTNEVQDEVGLCFKDANGEVAGKTGLNTYTGGGILTPIPQGFNANQRNTTSPFYLCGAYFSGLPAGSQLTINTIYYIERFVDASNPDLVVLTQPSPFYDPVAIELYSRAAQHLPVGTKVKNNADGDWIKNVADVLGTFGVPGMPFVKGAVDLWNGFSTKGKDGTANEERRLAQMEGKLNGITSGQRAMRVQQVRQPKQIGWYQGPGARPFNPRMNAGPKPKPQGQGKKAKKNKKKKAKKM